MALNRSLIIVLAFGLFMVVAAHRISTSVPLDEEVWCRNPEGNRVEWFVMYKAPKTAHPDRRARRYALEGSEYGYIDSDTALHPQVFQDGADGIYAEHNNPLAHSLIRLFKRQKVRASQELTYIVYNDQPPHDVTNSSSNGHTKGVVLFSDQSGLWLVHSVPRFPDGLFSGRYSFPSNARENGQSIICITLRMDELNTVASHLRKQNPNMYYASAPPAVRKKYAELDLLLAKKLSRKQPWIMRDVVHGINGTVFTAFAKSGRLNKDVYSSVLAPALETDLFVESWRNGNGGKLPPDCIDRFKVTDVQKIAMPVGNKTLRWASQEDHSKWAVGDKGSWFCIGSINRMVSQFKRGGETICMQIPGVHELFAKSMVEYAPCPNTDGINTRGRTHIIEQILQNADDTMNERAGKNGTEGAENAHGRDAKNLPGNGVQTPSSAAKQPVSTNASAVISRTLQAGIQKLWNSQRRKILVELEGLRGLFG